MNKLLFSHLKSLSPLRSIESLGGFKKFQRTHQSTTVNTFHNRQRTPQPLLVDHMKKNASTSYPFDIFITEEARNGNPTNFERKCSEHFFNTRHYSFFSKKTKTNFPIKCKLKLNQCGEKIAEPYVAKEPSCIHLKLLTKDFTSFSDGNCQKLQRKIVICPSEPRMNPNFSINCSKKNNQCPNALTKYLNTKGECKNMYRGNEGEDVCEIKDPSACDIKGLSTGRECALEDPCGTGKRGPKYIRKATVRQSQAKKVVNSLMSKLKSKKMLKSSGYINEELINKTVCKMRKNFPRMKTSFETLITVRETFGSEGLSNCEKTFEKKFGDQNISNQISTEADVFSEVNKNKSGAIRELNCISDLPVENIRERLEKSNVVQKISREILKLPSDLFGKDKMSRIGATRHPLKVLEVERNAVVIKNVNNFHENRDCKPEKILENRSKYVKRSKKTKKEYSNRQRIRNSVGRRKRRSKFWFSRIPIEPNIKGSVIFANGTAQVLDDPCKILAANFSDSEDIYSSYEIAKNNNANVLISSSAADNFEDKLASNSILVEDLGIRVYPRSLKGVDNSRDTTINDGKSVEKQVKRRTVVQTLKNKHSSRMKIENTGGNCVKNSDPEQLEPIIRQKKISKLDKSIKSFSTTVFPQKKLVSIKNNMRQKSTERNNKRAGAFLPTDQDESNVDLIDYQVSTFSDVLNNNRHAATTNNLLIEQERPKTTSSIGSDFKNKIKGITEIKSETGLVKSKVTNRIFARDETVRRKLISCQKNQHLIGKKDIMLSPGMTRPVTPKITHLDIPKTKGFKPISSTWRNGPASTGRISSPRETVGQKKLIGSANNVTAPGTKDFNIQQTRLKSTWKSTLSWKSRCECEKPCPNKKKNYNAKADAMYPLPPDWDYEARVPEELAQKWGTWECPKEKDVGCPITSEDLKKGPPCRKPSSAAALNRCNLDECQNRLKCRRPISKCRDQRKKNQPIGPGK